MIFQQTIHYSLHFIAPFFLAFLFVDKNISKRESRKQWRKALLILLIANIVDIDHLWAYPIFDANRCSIGFHFFHSYFMIGLYLIGAFFPYKRTKINPLCRIFFIGILWHMLVDTQDYYLWHFLF